MQGRLNVRVEYETEAIIKALADEYGYSSASSFVRMILDMAIDKIIEERYNGNTKDR
jgi:AraC-like DNA-binding protein